MKKAFLALAGVMVQVVALAGPAIEYTPTEPRMDDRVTITVSGLEPSSLAREQESLVEDKRSSVEIETDLLLNYLAPNKER